MNLNSIPFTVNVQAPRIWAGSYKYLSGEAGSWSWYKDGNRQATCRYAIGAGAVGDNFAPHITISNAPHETGPGNSWIGFHVSIPVPGGGVNARFNYSVAGGVVKFSNTTIKGFSDQSLAQIRRIEYGLPNEINAFAQAFVTAAWR